MDDIKNTIEVAGKVLEAAPEIYEDGLKPTVKETGKTLSLIPKMINAMLSPIWEWVLHKEYNVAKTEKLLQKKLEKIDADKIVTPEPYVAVPAIQSLQYSMDSEELRDLYANLIAKAMNTDTKDRVHPTFVEIIKQMSPIAALIFKMIYKSTVNPLIDLKVKKTTGGYQEYANNIFWIYEYSYEQVAVSINNLTRLGLIEIPYDKHYTHDDVYDSVRNNSHYKEKKEILEKLGLVEEDKKIISKTELSELFYKICVEE